ncbi:flagellar export chaperone FliS [Ornithinibacillus gellani]|uniref:flagellar export chaperone FliS n=1 Tax=Ornithinibacillus gellani TaxID=2293253 RepID=UPI000F46A25A|nr:flagellar export chaperone FliS [Ornithinibacillus gellani]TQS74824.1 flagellar export chaperone FliS [Ornithinibacillus gellani]
MAVNKFETYQNNAVNTASGGELTMMLYNGCMKFIKQAIKDMEQKDIEKKNEHIQKAQRIIQELMITLDQKVELSKQMLPLYEYMYHRLMEANINNDPSMLEEVLAYVVEFRDVWKEVLLQSRTSGYTQGARI